MEKGFNVVELDSWRTYEQEMMDKSEPVTSQLFEDALEHLDKHGWTQGKDVDLATGAVCSEGAFGLSVVTLVQYELEGFLPQTTYTTSRHDLDRMQTFTYRMAEIMDLMGIDPAKYGSVIDWNDTDGRTKEDVVEALTLGAKKLREQGR